MSPNAPARSVGEFIAYARANPDVLNYASNNLSEFMGATQFMKATGTSMVRVPYKGGAQSMPDLIAGRVQANFAPVSAALPYVRDGRLRMLAVLLLQRSPLVPDVPTMAETGVPGISVPGWQAIFAPAKTPKEIIDRLFREIDRTLQSPEVRAQFDRQAVQVEGSTPEALAAIIEEDLRTWRQVHPRKRARLGLTMNAATDPMAAKVLELIGASWMSQAVAAGRGWPRFPGA